MVGVDNSLKMGFADCTDEQWQSVLAEANRINGEVT